MTSTVLEYSEIKLEQLAKLAMHIHNMRPFSALAIACALSMHVQLFCAQGSAPSTSKCQPLSLAVDGHRVRAAMAAAQRPAFAWQLPTIPTGAAGGGDGGSSAPCARQVAYQVHVTATAGASGAVLFDSGRVNSTVSDGVRLPPRDAPPLPSMRELAFRVRVWAGNRSHSNSSGVLCWQKQNLCL